MSEFRVLFVTTPTKEVSMKIASALVEEKLAACVNILPDATSVYVWEGKVETDEEQLLVIKTTQAKYAALEARVKALHPYDVPEIIALPIEAGLPEYLSWLKEETS